LPSRHSSPKTVTRLSAARAARCLSAISPQLFLRDYQQHTEGVMYPPPIGVLPITGFNMIAFGLLAAALIIGGLIFLRIAHFARSRR
jgi:hypothetical protein